jgi:sugar phosphate permease
VTFGLLNSAAAIGAVIGAFYAASRKDILGLERRSVFFASVFGAALILFSFSKIFWISLLFVAASGLGAMMHNTSAISFVQTIVPQNKRGRVMSFYALAHQGIIPIGSILLGWAAAAYGAPAAMLVSGILCFLISFYLGPKIFSEPVK